MTAWPNVLILSQVVPESAYAGSLLLLRLLQTYPPECLRVIGPLPQPGSDALKCPYAALTVPFERLHRTRLAKLTRTLRTLGLLPRPSIWQVNQRLRGFRPDVVITVMQTEAYYSLAADYARRLGVPLVLLVHDLAEEFEPVFPFARRAQFARNRHAFRAAARRLCISPAMSTLLARTYGATAEVLPPNRSEAIAARPLAASATLRTPGTLTIGYAGSLAYGYGAGLCELLPALETSHARLCLYTDQRLPQESPFVEYRGRGKTPEETWSRVQGECDAVVLAYAWDEAYRSLYETHFPSKLPEYLALGLPVLIAGPPDAAGVRWGLENGGAGLVLNERSLSAAQQALRDLRETSSRRQELAAGALAAGSAQFDPVRVRETFVGVLQSLTVRPENPPGSAHG